MFLDIEIHCGNSDEEYYYKKCINLFLENSWDFKLRFLKYKKLFKSRFFLFVQLEKLLPEI